MSPPLINRQHEPQSAVPQEAPVDFDEPGSVLAFVLERCHGVTTVYPTEGYLYYTFDLGHRAVSGNIRFTDIDRGALHIGYFDRYDPRAVRTASFDAAGGGIGIRPVGHGIFQVEYAGRVAEFHIPAWTFEVDPALVLEEEEQAISGILDESGFALTLVWNDRHSVFYYLLNRKYGVPDVMSSLTVNRRELRVARSSRFVFLIDHGSSGHVREILVGVWSRNVSDNNYFDGPFDQVPPRLFLREKLERMYPTLALLGGIDEHGNYLRHNAQRVAISRYMGYAQLDEVRQRLERLEENGLAGSELWARMTDERESDHAPSYGSAPPQPTTLGELWGLSKQPRSHTQWLSQGWPANHMVDASASWSSLRPDDRYDKPGSSRDEPE